MTVTVTETPSQNQYALSLEAANDELRQAVARKNNQHATAPLPPVAEAACDVGAAECCHVEPLTKPAKASPPAEDLLQNALDVIRDRRANYGGPRDHFRRTVGMINAAFSEVLRRPLTPGDWAQIMILDKIARHQGPAPTPDTPIDLAGYAGCLHEAESEE
jgi:hypothetical protein